MKLTLVLPGVLITSRVLTFAAQEVEKLAKDTFDFNKKLAEVAQENE